MKDLIKALQKQDPRAQKKLYDLFAVYLFSICKRYLNNLQLCQEVVSQALLKIYRNIPKIDLNDKAALMGWMKRIVINEVLMEFRKSGRVIVHVSVDACQEFSPFTSDAALNNEDLMKMVMSLPMGYRTVFCLFVIDGYSHQEIAENLEITLGTSRSQLYKARMMLQEIIEQNEKAKHVFVKR